MYTGAGVRTSSVPAALRKQIFDSAAFVLLRSAIPEACTRGIARDRGGIYVLINSNQVITYEAP